MLVVTETEIVFVAVACTVSMLIGWLAGSREKKYDQEIIDGEAWHQHWCSALWVTRPDSAVSDDTVVL